MERAQEIYKIMQRRWNVIYDQSGAIGRRYRRQDAIGTPFCLTVDFDTLENGTVTLRDRDTLKQERLTVAQVEDIVRSKVSLVKLLDGLNL